MKLLASLVLFFTICQENYAQSELDSVNKKLGPTKAVKIIGPMDPYYFGNFNYPVKPERQVELSLNKRMVLAPAMYPDYVTKYQVSGSANLVTVLIDVLINSSFYYVEQQKLQKYQ